MNRNLIKTKEFKVKFIISIILLILFSVSFFFKDNLENVLGLKIETAQNQVSNDKIENSSYKVHYLDVGQGNCTVVELPDDKIMLIDGGGEFYGEKIYKMLKSLGRSKIDYMIASHADSDHIGGLNYLFDKFEIINIYRPLQIAGRNEKVYSANCEVSYKFKVSEYEDLNRAYTNLGKSHFVETVSETYCDFIEKAYSETYYENGVSKKSNITVFYDRLKIEGENYSLEFFAPLKTDEEIDLSTITNTNGFLTKIYKYDKSNNSSAIMLLNVCGDKYFFTGDASANVDNDKSDSDYEESDFLLSLTKSEKENLSNIDVYLAAHHGSYYGTSDNLVSLLSPRFAVVSVGINEFGHPHGETIFRLMRSKNIESDGILKTNETGNITFSNLENKVCYSTELRVNEEKYIISYPLLAIIIFGLIESIVIFIKPKSKSN